MRPELVIHDCRVEDVLAELDLPSDVLLVTDPYNAPTVRRFGTPIVVKNIFHKVSLQDISQAYGMVVAVGGCSALDVGRYYARGKRLIVIPTILSTSCISVNISIIRSREEKTLLKTAIPEQTIIPIKSIVETKSSDLERWSASGLGDLFANISACMDYEARSDLVSAERILANASEAIDALEWALTSFSGYDEGALRKLALHLHNSSVDVIERGDTALSAGFEHHLYETLIRQQTYNPRSQTHGILVAMGTLLTVAIFEKRIQDLGLYAKLREGFKRVGLPVSLEEFEALGIRREHLVGALETLWDLESFVIRHLKENGFSILDEAYAADSPRIAKERR